MGVVNPHGGYCNPDLEARLRRYMSGRPFATFDAVRNVLTGFGALTDEQLYRVVEAAGFDFSELPDAKPDQLGPGFTSSAR